MSPVAKWTLFAGYVAASVAGLAILRSSLPSVTWSARALSSPSPKMLWLVCGAALYILSFGLWMFILRSMPLAVAYPAAVGATLCGTSIVSVTILGENIRVGQGAGIALIMVGVVLVFRGR